MTGWSTFGGCLLASAADRVSIERRIEFEALPGGWARVAGLAVAGLTIWAVVWMYRREGRAGSSLRVRLGLAVVRSVVLLILMAIYLEPVLATYVTRWIESYTLVVVDDSASMDLRDLYRDSERGERVGRVLGKTPSEPVRRIDLVNRVLSGPEHRLAEALTRRNGVKVYAFGEALEPVAALPARRAGGDSVRGVADGSTGSKPVAHSNSVPGDGGDLFSFSARGSATAAGRAVRRALQENAGVPVAGVILVSDGGFTESDAAEAIVSAVGEYGVPLFVVGVGDPAPPRNVRVVEATAPDSVFAGDPFEITAHLSATGLAGTTLEVELYERRADGSAAAVRVEVRQAPVTDDGALEPVTFARRRPETGRWTYRVEVPVGRHETVGDDNGKQVVVNVLDSRLRVLLVSGGPSWEYRYLSRLLVRDDSFEVSCWLQSADVDAVRDGNTVIDHLPDVAEDLFAYDAIVLLDPDPALLPTGWGALAARLVSEYGGGLVYAAARVHTPQSVHDEAMRPLVALWPVSPDPEADLILNRIGHYQRRPSTIEVPEPSLGHPVLKLVDDPAGNRLAWQGIGDLYWHYPVLRAKAVATVLLRHGDPRMANSSGGHVLVATQFVGAGRSAFVAFDGTWRWRRYGEAVYDGFWVRLLRYVVEGKLLGAKNRGLIVTDSDNYQLGSAVVVQARVYDEQFEPLRSGTVRGTYGIEGSRGAFTLSAIGDRPGWFEGRFVPDRTGNYELRLEVPGNAGGQSLTVRREIQVSRPNVEILRPQMNRAGLVALAADVEQGRYFEIDETAGIPDEIVDRHETTTVRSRPRPLWDSGWLLAGLIGLLSVEWAVRKWSRLL